MVQCHRKMQPLQRKRKQVKEQTAADRKAEDSCSGDGKSSRQMKQGRFMTMSGNIEKTERCTRIFHIRTKRILSVLSDVKSGKMIEYAQRMIIKEAYMQKKLALMILISILLSSFMLLSNTASLLAGSAYASAGMCDFSASASSHCKQNKTPTDPSCAIDGNDCSSWDSCGEYGSISTDRTVN